MSYFKHVTNFVKWRPFWTPSWTSWKAPGDSPLLSVSLFLVFCIDLFSINGPLPTPICLKLISFRASFYSLLCYRLLFHYVHRLLLFVAVWRLTFYIIKRIFTVLPILPLLHWKFQLVVSYFKQATNVFFKWWPFWMPSWIFWKAKEDSQGLLVCYCAHISGATLQISACCKLFPVYN